MKTILMLGAIALLLGACANARDSRMLDGAMIGGAGGAVVGGVVSGTYGGAAVGAVAGAALGAVVADATRPRQRRARCYINVMDQRVCRYR